MALDTEKDLYIKEKFKKDELISKKANDVFNNFFGGKIEMESNKIEDINEAKDKKINRKQILSIVATLMIVFLGVNVYAISQGYNNVFFLIKDLSTKDEISGKSELFKDQDITISYETIEIAEGLAVQFNRFVVKDNEATLFMKIDQREDFELDKKITQVEILNEDDNSQLVTETIKDDDKGTYTKEIKIAFFDNNIEKLKVNINSQEECLAVIEIDLKNKEIIVLSNSYKEIEKISEIELKEALSNYAVLNSYEDRKEIINQYDVVPTKEQYINYDLVECAIEYIYSKEANTTNIDFSLEKVNAVIKEITGMELNSPLDMQDGFYYYDEENKKYDHDIGDSNNAALCLNITDISYEDGIYTVDYQYCYPGETDYLDNKMDKLPVYEETLQFKLNENYVYTEYCIVSDIYNLKSKKIKENSATTSVETTNEELVSLNNNEYDKLENLAIEYRLSSKVRNYKDFNYDLDSDGKIDKITIRKDKNDEEGRNYKFELNGIEFAENCFSPEIYIVDLNENDKSIEVIIFDQGPSDDLEYSIYVKNGNTMKLIETIGGQDLILDGNGNFKVKSILTAGITPDVYDIVYNFNANKITSKNNDFDKEAYYSTYGLFYITKTLDNIEKFQHGEVDTLEDAGIKEISTDISFKIKYFIDATKAVIDYNGTEYYLLSYQGNFAD